MPGLGAVWHMLPAPGCVGMLLWLSGVAACVQGVHLRLSHACAPDQALQEGCVRGEAELTQVPLEAIVAHNPEGLAAVRTLLESRHPDVAKAGGHSHGGGGLISPRGSALSSPRVGVAGLKGGAYFGSLLTSPRAGSSAGFPACLHSPFLAALAEWGGGVEDDFDSGAETDWEAGSQVTDMADSCCSD